MFCSHYVLPIATKAHIIVPAVISTHTIACSSTAHYTLNGNVRQCRGVIEYGVI